MRMIGIVLIVLGVIGLAWGGISWTTRETVADLGPLEISQEERETLPLPPIAGAVLVIAGAAVLIGAKR
jgi:drug/metabolite transporter (DMT)-like permease